MQLKQQLEHTMDEKTTRSDGKQKAGEEHDASQDNDIPALIAKRDNRKRQTTTRVASLELLHGFIQTELGYYLELQSRVEAGLLTRIAFEDLWYLFQPGEVLYEEVWGYQQLLRTYSVTGGQLRRRNPTRQEHDSNPRVVGTHRFHPHRSSDSEDDSTDEDSFVWGIGTWSPFKIDCFEMEFDGLSIGPVNSCKKIKHYSGEIKITDLPIYPLRFHKQRGEIAAKLEARGKDFISSYGHRMYNGLTLPSSRRGYQEELRGDIFIDLKTYYRENSKRRPKFGMLQKSAPDTREVHESIAVSGSKWRVLFDHEVDEKIADEYLASNHAFMEPVNSELVQDSVEHLQLLPCRIPAFVFRTRAYG